MERWVQREDALARQAAWADRPTEVQPISAACWTASWRSDRAASCLMWCCWWRVDPSRPTEYCWQPHAIILGKTHRLWLYCHCRQSRQESCGLQWRTTWPPVIKMTPQLSLSQNLLCFITCTYTTAQGDQWEQVCVHTQLQRPVLSPGLNHFLQLINTVLWSVVIRLTSIMTQVFVDNGK